MQLTGPEYSELEDALRDAYVGYDDLALTLRRAGQRIQDITSPGPFPTVVSDVIEFAETRDWVPDLVAAARATNPSNVRLFKVSAAIGLEPAGIPITDVPADKALSQVTAQLERMVDPKRGIADLGSLVARYQELVHQVCAVELGDESGTGFLIGPETILTNYHVVESAIKEEFDPAQIRVRFDYRKLRDELTTVAGVTYELADDWLVAAEKYSPFDKQPYSADRVPAGDELDYAVLRTAVKVGRESPSGPVEGPRGWLTPLPSKYDFPVDSFLRVVQHPCHDPISYDDVDDAVVRVNSNRTRVQYRTNTLPGSSGSPVLTRKLELVALHHAGEPGTPDFGLPCHKQVTPASYNEGIPIDTIQKHLTDAGLSWVFGQDAP
jgi:V8-like Glu-specific endopeptidase